MVSELVLVMLITALRSEFEKSFSTESYFTKSTVSCRFGKQRIEFCHAAGSQQYQQAILKPGSQFAAAEIPFASNFPRTDSKCTQIPTVIVSRRLGFRLGNPLRNPTVALVSRKLGSRLGVPLRNHARNCTHLAYSQVDF